MYSVLITHFVVASHYVQCYDETECSPQELCQYGPLGVFLSEMRIVRGLAINWTC
ncbi:hypothetical protein CMUST_12640 [Corynebacterium mustelae]|uniref:Uncharacterized protein n=1 Tax=Corynebacterium mustelae TaxID=571915 RepID=A0A0G3H4S9_9CORY|nr:hypothetical protein CMUST_12640 [Corynebacterium mustelae]